MANPLASIWDDVPAAPARAAPAVAWKPKHPVKAVDHTEAERVYTEFVVRKARLVQLRAYARRVAAATNDSQGMTPIEPLARMGTGGGPLLCDHCGKAIILEGGRYDKVPADAAWERGARGVSYISGGLMVGIVSNGTLRIYHGYGGGAGRCCTVADAAIRAAEAAHKLDLDKFGPILDYLLFMKIPNADKMASEVFHTMYGYDPGFGVNQPE